MGGPGTSMRVIVSSTGISRPSACSAVISTRWPSSAPCPRASPWRWRSRRCGGTSTAPSSRPTIASGSWPKSSPMAALTSTIRPSLSIVITASSAASSIARLRASLSCTACELPDLSGRGSASVASSASSGSCTGAVRNSITPAAGPSGMRERGVQPHLGGLLAAREVRVGGDVLDPGRRTARPHPPGQPFARGELERAAGRGERVQRSEAVHVAAQCSAPDGDGSQRPP